MARFVFFMGAVLTHSVLFEPKAQDCSCQLTLLPNPASLRRMRATFLLLLSLLPAWAVGTQGEVLAHDSFAPAPPGAIALHGPLADKLELCIQNRLLAQNIEAVVKPYRQKKEIGSGDWRCEYWGKWYTSLALADAYQSTPQTRAKLADAAQALLATAAPDGYLGTRLPEHRLKGWDVWGRKYALLGVLAYYDRTHNPAALLAARRHLDTLLAEVGPGKTNIANLGEHKGLAASSVLEPVVLLYQRTGDPKCLEFAQYIVGQWSKPSRTLPQGLRLIEEAMAHTPPARMSWNKAYEMMSCFEGLCELYRVTGNWEYREAATRLADSILRNEVTLVGPGTSVEVWCGGHTNQTGVVDRPMETCVTATWMKLLYQVLRLTGEPRFADELEKNLYNGLLGATMPDGSWWAYFSAPMGERVPSDMQHDDVGLSCCVCNGPRGLMLTPFWAVMTSADGPVINLCTPLRAHLTTPCGKPLEVEITGDYPLSGKAEFRLHPDAPEEFTVALRIPAWSQKTDLRVNGQRVETRPGTYAKIRRRWRPGDRIKVAFDFRGRILQAPDGNGDLAVQRGPVVLSLDNRLAPPQPGVLATLDQSRAPFIRLKADPKAARKIGAWMAFDAPFQLNGKAAKLTFCDFASAGNQWRQANNYRTWLPQPLDLGKLYQTGQTWRLLTHRSFRPVPPKANLAISRAK